MSIGVPIKVMHEAEGHIVTIETCDGETHRGKLVEAEDNMNLQMQDVNTTYRDGRTAHLPYIFVRGSKVRFMILPDMLKNAPMFKKMISKPGTAKGTSSITKSMTRGGKTTNNAAQRGMAK